MNYFGDTPADNALVAQIQTLLAAPGANSTPQLCQANLSQANNLLVKITSQDARTKAQNLITNFSNLCGPDYRKWILISLIGSAIVTFLVR